MSVRQRSSSSTRAEWLDWQPGDEGLEVADAGENVEPRHHVRVVRGGTFVELSGADRMLLIELARSLVPAPAEAPRLQ